MMQRISWKYLLPFLKIKAEILPILLLIICVTLSSCGYRGVYCDPKVHAKPVSVALISIDDNGIFRQKLARALSATGQYYYSSYPTRYQLCVEILQNQTHMVGYMWDRSPITGVRLDRLYPSEQRRFIKAKVTLKDTELKENLINPFEIYTQVDFDFVNPTVLKNVQFKDVFRQTQSVLQYSLGQLDSEEGGQNESYEPLFDLLTEKIISGILIK